MFDIGYILWRLLSRWIAGVVAILLIVGVGYGLLIGDVKKGVNDVYVRPVQAAFTWLMEKRTERIQERMERMTEGLFGGSQ